MTTRPLAIISMVNPYRRQATGGSIEIRRRIAALVRAGVPVHLIATDYPHHLTHQPPSPATGGPHQWTFCERRVTAPAVARCLHTPWPTATRHSRALSRAIETSGLRGADVIIEGLQMALSLPDARAAGAHRLILRVHNLESDYYRHLAQTASLGRRWLYRRVALQYAAMEQSMSGQFDRLHFISDQERDTFVRCYPSLADRAVHIPPISLAPPSCTSPEPRAPNRTFHVRHFADMSISSNRAGLDWFVREVWPTVLHEIPHASFEVAGHGSESLRGRAFRGLGFVPDLDAFVHAADVMVLPILHGAGVKIKTLDTLSYGRPLVATAKALEGTAFRDSPVVPACRSATDMASQIIAVRNDPHEATRAATGAARLVQELYGESIVTRALLADLRRADAVQIPSAT